MATTGSSGAMFGTTASGIPLSHLDYSYIGKCTNAAELEKILKVLRSGDEGTYPQLISFTEKQLESINPKSKALRKDIPVQSYRDLGHEEREQISHEFKDWISEINQKDVILQQDSELKPQDNDYLPPIRSTKTVGSTTSGRSQVSNDRVRSNSKKGSQLPRGYQEWDKFSPDEELKALEEKEQQELKLKKEKAKLNTKEAEISSDIKTSGKTDAELVVLADREKDKGNEAFRCGDYRESLVYYSRSISYRPSAASYNNRAFAHLKLEKYKEAIEDCNMVISMEPDNIKALLRRALAHKSAGEKVIAKHDLNKVLEIEPNNKRAKELLGELDEFLIVEDNKPTIPQLNGQTQPKKKGKRLKIIEVENDEEPTGSEEKEEKAVYEANGHPPQNNSTDGISTNVVEKQNSNTEENNLSSSNAMQESELKTDPMSFSLQSNDIPPSNPVNAEKPSEGVPPTPVAPPPEVTELPTIVLRAKDDALSLYKLGRYAEAVEKFTTAIEILEKDKLQFQSALSSLLNNRAACLYHIGDAQGCIKDCSASLALIPNSVKPLVKRADSNALLERYELSYVDYDTVVFIDPKNRKAVEGKTRVSKHLLNIHGSSWREKVQNIKVSSTPTSTELLNTDNTAAEKPFKILQNSEPNATGLAPSVPPRSIKENSVLNATGHAPSMPPRSTKEKEEPIGKASAPEAFDECKEKGNSFVKQGKLEDAIHCYTRCIALDASKVAVYTNRALCYLRTEKYNLAEEDATMALDLQEDNVKALYRRGLARKALHKYEDAAKDFISLVKIDPSNTAGQKELEIVLDFCREQRKTKQKAASSSEAKSTTQMSNEKQKESGSEVRKKSQRRRVQIQEINEEEGACPASGGNSSTAIHKTPAGSTSETTKDDKPQALNKNKVEGRVKSSMSKEESNVRSPKPTEHKKKKIKLNKAGAFDFYQAWNSVKQKDLSCYADILRQLQPTLLPKVLSNKLDADMLRSIIGAISEQMLPNGEEKLSFEILQNLCEAQRFEMTMMFLDGKDTRAILNIFSKLDLACSKGKFADKDLFNQILKKYNIENEALNKSNHKEPVI